MKIHAPRDWKDHLVRLTELEKLRPELDGECESYKELIYHECLEEAEELSKISPSGPLASYAKAIASQYETFTEIQVFIAKNRPKRR